MAPRVAESKSGLQRIHPKTLGHDRHGQSHKSQHIPSLNHLERLLSAFSVLRDVLGGTQEEPGRTMEGQDLGTPWHSAPCLFRSHAAHHLPRRCRNSI